MTTLTTWIATLLLAASLAGGATPGLARYNQYVAQLSNVGCHLVWPATWGRSYWGCPVNQLWSLTLDEAHDTATLRRIR